VGPGVRFFFFSIFLLRCISWYPDMSGQKATGSSHVPYISLLCTSSEVVHMRPSYFVNVVCVSKL